MIVTIPATGAVGIVSDEVPQELPDGAWGSGENVRFEYGYATRMAGHVEVLNRPSTAAQHVVNYRSALGDFWVHTTLTGAFADDGTTKTDITGAAFTGTADDVFTSTTLGGVLYLNNGADEPQYWGGDVTAPLALLPGWNGNWRARSLRSFKANLIALNISKGSTRFPSMVKWSDTTDPGAVPLSWDEADPTGDARELDLAETSDSVVDGLPMGDVFVVYKDRSMYGLQATGGNDVFRYFRLPGDHGMLAPNCCASFPGGHVVLTPSDVVTHNGAGPQSILEGRMRKWLFSRIDGTNFRRSFLAHNPARAEVWICFPDNGDATCTKALIWNYRSNTFGVRDLPSVTAASFGPLVSPATNSWDNDTEAWDLDATTWNQRDISEADQRVVISGDRLFLMDQSTRFDGVDFETRIQRTGMALGDPSRVKMIRAVYPRIDAPTGTQVQIQVGGSLDPERAPAWSAPVTYTVGSTYKADTFATGRFLALRLTGNSGRWRLKSVDVDFVTRGAY
jgi:hypothetical protein